MGNSLAAAISLSCDQVFDCSIFKNADEINAERLKNSHHLVSGSHQAGQRLYGIVYIVVKEKVDASSLDLKVTGFERTKVSDGEGHTTDRNIFFESSIPLVNKFERGALHQGKASANESNDQGSNLKANKFVVSIYIPCRLATSFTGVVRVWIQ